MVSIAVSLRAGVITVLLCSLVLLIPGGCSVENESKDVYTIADPTGDWGYPSPYAHYPRGPGYVRMSLLFDTLLWKDNEDIVPALAKSWSYLENECAYRFELRRDVTWHDGEELTARDVVFTMEYIKKHPYQFVDSGAIRKAYAPDSYTVKIYLEEPAASFLESVAGTLPILPSHIWEQVSNPTEYRHESAFIGSGPFILVDYNKAQGTYLYRENQDYYGGKPLFEELRFTRISPEMAGSALIQKRVNAAQVPADQVEEIDAEDLVVISGSHDWVAKLLINHTREPLDSKDFRQALAYAIDRTALVETCLRGHALPGAPGLLPPDHPWHEPLDKLYPNDPERARQILNGLGYTTGKDGFYEKDGVTLELVLLLSGSATAAGAPGEREGEMLKQQLAAAGIKLRLRSLEAKTLDNRVLEWQFDLALSGHGGVGGDAGGLSRFIDAGGFNSARYTENAKLLDLLKAQEKEMEQDIREELLREIQLLYAEKMPALPLYYPTWYWAHDGQAELFYTVRGLASGIPIPLNKAAFLRD